MHAVVVRVTLKDPDSARQLLESQVIPRVSGVSGFKAGYWTWDDGHSNGVSMVIFDSEEGAAAAANAVPSMISDAVSLESVEVREVVASA